MSRRPISILSSLLIASALMVPAFAGGKSLLIGTRTLDLARFGVANPPRSVTVYAGGLLGSGEVACRPLRSRIRSRFELIGAG